MEFFDIRQMLWLKVFLLCKRTCNYLFIVDIQRMNILLLRWSQTLITGVEFISNLPGSVWLPY